MGKARELGFFDENGRCYGGGYSTIINYIGTPAVRVDSGDYQGDTFCLFFDSSKGIGFLMFGWGSCSGCDGFESALDGGETLMDAFIDDMIGSVRWFLTKSAAIDYLTGGDDSLQWYAHVPEWGTFKTQAVEAINDWKGVSHD